VLYVESAEHHRLLDPELYRVPDADAGREVYARKLESEETGIFVADRDGTVVGFAEARLVRSDPAGMLGFALAAEIGIAVAANHRRGGIGAALIDAVEEWARERGAERLTLSTHAANDGAIRLYERLGYRRFGLLMQKPLH
jgi:ribosomal protein S18 acetylase RimI-like enzyme